MSCKFIHVVIAFALFGECKSGNIEIKIETDIIFVHILVLE